MWWQRDDLADQLIANNAARPRPGMDKPDLAMMRMPGQVTSARATRSDPRANEDSGLVLEAADPKPQPPTEPA